MIFMCVSFEFSLNNLNEKQNVVWLPEIIIDIFPEVVTKFNYPNYILLDNCWLGWMAEVT